MGETVTDDGTASTERETGAHACGCAARGKTWGAAYGQRIGNTVRPGNAGQRELEDRIPS